MKEYKTNQIRNISILGSSQIGKTSLSEAILFNAGVTNRQGLVDDGTSILDYGSEEIARKISISSSPFKIELSNVKLNFIDTPGYPAFVSQAICAIDVCETSLVVLGSVAGVEVLTKRMWKYAEKEGQSKIVFINKMDKEQAHFEEDISQIKNILSKKVYPITIPIGVGDNFKGVVDIIKQKAFIDVDNSLKEEPIPENLLEKVAYYRSELIEAVAENDEVLLEKYLETGNLNFDEIMTGLKIGVNTLDIYPAFAGSAKKNIGVRILLDYLSKITPDPIAKDKMFTFLDSDGQVEHKKLNPEGHTLLHIFKITENNKIGEFFFFKVLQGVVRPSQELMDFNTKQKERIGHLFEFNGKNKIEVPVLYAGDIGSTSKLKLVSIGDTLCDSKDELKLKNLNFPEPVIEQAVVTHNSKDFEKIGEALLGMHKIDPCFKYEHRPEFDELVVQGMSSLHIEVMMSKIKEKTGIQVDLEAPKIPYRETIKGVASAQGKYKKQTGGHGQYGDCWVEVMSKPLGSGYNFVNKISGGVIPSKYIPAVEKGVVEALSKGVYAGYPIVDVQVKLFDGSHHSVDSSDLAFQMAGIMAVKSAIEKANPILLEPIMLVKVVIPEEYVGDVSADFNQRRGKIISMDADSDGYKIIKALVPMSELYRYSDDLKSMTKGDGVYSKYFEKYEIVPSHIAEKVKKERLKQIEHKN